MNNKTLTLFWGLSLALGLILFVADEQTKTANAAASYEHPLGAGLLLRGRLDYSYLSSRGNIVNSRSPSYFSIDGAGLTNLHVSLERQDGWTAGLHVYNLLNDFVPMSGKMADANLVRTITAARPRTVGLSLNKSF